MSYWTFLSIIHTAESNRPHKGKLKTREGLYQSQKDMIARTKELQEK